MGKMRLSLVVPLIVGILGATAFFTGRILASKPENTKSAPVGQEDIQELIEALGARYLSDREEAVRVLRKKTIDAQVELEKAARDSDLKRAAGARRVLFLKGLKLDDVKRALTDIAKSTPRSWREFSWQATALLEDLIPGIDGATASRALKEQGFPLVFTEDHGDWGVYFFHHIGPEISKERDGGRLVIRLHVGPRTKELDKVQKVISAGVGLLGGPELLQDWRKTCAQDGELDLVAKALGHEEMEGTWKEGFNLTSVAIVCGDFYPLGSHRDPPLREVDSGFELECNFKIPDEHRTKRVLISVASGLGPLEEWRARVEGRGPKPVNSIGELTFRGGNEVLSGGRYVLAKGERLRLKLHGQASFTWTTVQSDKELRDLGPADGIVYKTSELTAEGLAELCRREELKGLDLSHVGHIDRQAVSKISRLRKLERLTLGVLEGDALDECAFDAVTSLTLEGCRLSKRMAVALARFNTVKRLSLASVTGVSEELIKGIVAMESLEELSVSGYPSEEVSLAWLRDAKRLKSLRLTSIALRGLTEQSIKAMSALRRLDLVGVDISDNDLLVIATHDGMEELQLQIENKITNKGIMVLKSMKRVGLIEILGCSKISTKAMEELRAALGEQFGLTQR